MRRPFSTLFTSSFSYDLRAPVYQVRCTDYSKCFKIVIHEGQSGLFSCSRDFILVEDGRSLALGVCFFITP